MIQIYIYMVVVVVVVVVVGKCIDHDLLCGC
jgi:hypothetical protein